MKIAVLLVSLATAVACGPSGEAPEPPAPVPVQGPGVARAGDGLPIVYTVTGHGAPALVFIHGWMCNQGFWAEQVDAFSAEHTVVTLDLPGHGASGKDRESWTLAAYGEDVKAVVDHLGLERVILIGHSMGGPVALEAARLMPQRVIGVVGVDTIQDVGWEWNPEEMNAFIAAMERDFPATCSDFVASMFLEDADPTLVERVRADMCTGQPDVGVALMKQFGAYDEAAALAAVHVPVRCLNSTMWPTNVEGNRACHEDFDVVTMEGVDHFLMMEKPEAFDENLRNVIAEIDEAGRQKEPTSE